MACCLLWALPVTDYTSVTFFYMSEKYSSTLSWCFALGAAVLLFLLVLNSGAYGWSSPGDAEWVGSLDAEDKRHHCSLLLSRTALSYFHGTASTCLLHSKNKVLAPFFSCSIPLFFFFPCKSFEETTRYLYIRADIAWCWIALQIQTVSCCYWTQLHLLTAWMPVLQRRELVGEKIYLFKG